MKLAILSLAVLFGCGDQPATTPSVDAAHDSTADAQTPDGATVATDRSFYRASAGAGDFATFMLDATDIGRDGTLALGAAAHAATDPPSGFHGKSYYNGGDYVYGIAISPAHEVNGGFTSVVPS